MTNTRTRTLWMSTLLIAGAGALVNSCDPQDDTPDPFIDGRANGLGTVPADSVARFDVLNVGSRPHIERVPLHRT